MLIVLSGLPGVGKTTIARALTHALGAMHIRVDSIEQSLRDLGADVQGEGYAAARAVAEDNLRLGRTVIADSVNPWPLTRNEWRAVAGRAEFLSSMWKWCVRTQTNTGVASSREWQTSRITYYRHGLK